MSRKINPVWVATQLFLAPAITQILALRLYNPEVLFNSNGVLFAVNSWSLTPFTRWQLSLALIYVPFFYWRYKKSDFLVSVMIRSWLLGLGASSGIQLVLKSLHLGPTHQYLAPFGLYLTIFSLYHYLEFAAIGLSQPDKVSLDNFLFTYSDVDQDEPNNPIIKLVHKIWPGSAVHAAMVCPLIEYFGGLWFFGQEIRIGLVPWVPYLGFGLCIGAEIFRKAAMLTAAKSFNHFVQNKKADDHHLITGGIYSYSRHPSYVGYMAWIIGTQLILVNLVSLNIITLFAWAVLRNRIEREEKKLVEFFGPEYIDYRRRVPSGIPFIK